MVIVSIVIVCFYRHLSERNSRALLASLVFMFYSFFLTNTIFNRHLIAAIYSNHGGTVVDVLLPLFAFLFAMAGFALSFCVTYRVKDEEQARIIFFRTSLVIFVICLGYMVFDVTWGLINQNPSSLPGHSCNQAAFIFPVLFFMKSSKVRRLLLAYICISSFIGGIATIVPPRNILDGLTLLYFVELDTVVTHLLLVFVPLIIWTTKHIQMEWIDIPMTAIGLGTQILIAFILNQIVYLQIGFAGNWMWLTYDIRTWFPTWLFLLICYLAGAATAFVLVAMEKWDIRFVKRK